MFTDKKKRQRINISLADANIYSYEELLENNDKILEQNGELSVIKFTSMKEVKVAHLQLIELYSFLNTLIHRHDTTEQPGILGLLVSWMNKEILKITKDVLMYEDNVFLEANSQLKQEQLYSYCGYNYQLALTRLDWIHNKIKEFHSHQLFTFKDQLSLIKRFYEKLNIEDQHKNSHLGGRM